MMLYLIAIITAALCLQSAALVAIWYRLKGLRKGKPKALPLPVDHLRKRKLTDGSR